jgi:hypothetical protein
MEEAKEFPEPVSLFDNNELPHNIDSIVVVHRAHIQNNADEFLHPADTTFLFYKTNQKRLHNQADKAHQDTRYEDAMG